MILHYKHVFVVLDYDMLVDPASGYPIVTFVSWRCFGCLACRFRRGTATPDSKRHGYRYDLVRVGTGIEKVGRPCGTDADCAQNRGCVSGYCRCAAANDCHTLAVCKSDGDCVRLGDWFLRL